MNLKNIFLVSIKYLILLTVITGILYPFAITGIGQLFFREKSNGSMVEVNGIVSGSSLIAQRFDNDKYFQPRPSATSYSALPSGGSNLSPASLKLKYITDSIRASFREKNRLAEQVTVPSEMIFKSASGLDPHISKESAMLQAGRISEARNFNAEKRVMLEKLIEKFTEKPQFGVLGEERINVLLINIELDKL